MKALYCTADRIASGSGGGHVTTNELEALKKIAEEVVVLQRDDLIIPWADQSPFLYDYAALARVSEEKFDFAHFYSGTFSATVKWLKSRGCKVSYTSPFHARETTIEEFERQGLQYPYSHIKEDRLWAMFIDGLLNSDLVISPSFSSTCALIDEGCTRVKTVPHGCQLPTIVSELPEEFHVGYLGQTGPDKGISYLALAWEILGYSDSTLVLAGPGTEALAASITRSANRGKFKLLGYVEDPYQFFSSISVYVQPSVVEAFGIPVLEAMAHGRPIIVTEGVGAQDVVEDGVDGFIVPIRDPGAIAYRINWLRENPQQLVEMGTNARRKAELYSWNKVQRKYQDLWNTLIWYKGKS